MSDRVLIVEDEVILNQAYETILKKKGYDVQTAANGKEALETVKNFEPDVILLDLKMPVMDGVAFLRNYDLKKHPKVKVIVFSNFDMQKEVDEAYKLGATRYILKAGAGPNELTHIVERTLKED